MDGNEGCKVYLREAGYVVEHFRLDPAETVIVYTSKPFETREEAEACERNYRRKVEGYRTAAQLIDGGC